MITSQIRESQEKVSELFILIKTLNYFDIDLINSIENKHSQEVRREVKEETRKDHQNQIIDCQ